MESKEGKSGAALLPDCLVTRLIFINRYYRPDFSATSQMLTDLAEYLASAGNNVLVICSRQMYENPNANLPKQEIVADVSVHRIKTTRFGRVSLVGRTIDYFSFYIATFFWLITHLTRNDIVIAKTDPPLISFIAACAVSIRRARLLNWIQDLFPDIAFELGIKMPRIMKWLATGCRNFSLRIATRNVVIGERMAERLRKIPRVDRIVKIDNWSPGGLVKPVPHNVNPLRTQWGLDNKFVVGYSGNLGRAHDIETLLGAAQLLQAHRNICFLLIGGGAQRQEIESQANQLGLSNFVLQPYQPSQLLQYSISAADIHLVSLHPALEGLIVPSKFYGVIEAGRPVIFVGDLHGEIANLIRTFECGLVVASGDSARLAETILDLRGNPSKTACLCAAASSAVKASLGRSSQLNRWKNLIDNCHVDLTSPNNTAAR